MKVLLCDFGSYIYRDLVYFFRQYHIQCKTFFYHFRDKYQDPFYSKRLATELKQIVYDFVFSINFHPLIAQACAETGIKYLSWSYDSPLEEGIQDYFDLETNYIFLFDRIETEYYRKQGYKRVFHLPLAVNTDAFQAYLHSGVLNRENEEKYRTDISLVGRIYESSLDALLYGSDEYVKGYVESIFQAQLRVYGVNFVEEVITEELLERINRRLTSIGQSNLKLNKRGLAYAIESKITQTERTFLLSELGEICRVNLYAPRTEVFSDNVVQKGPVGYFDKMPLVFYYSRLNLNSTLKSIQSGIPLRALDVMACGGVLFSNYQPELAEMFEDGKEVIMYSSMDEAIEKASYYLQREDLLQTIAKLGHKKVREEYTYPDRLEKMLRLAGII